MDGQGIGRKPAAGEIDRRISQNVRTLRRIAGMTQKNLADELGWTYQNVHKVESGRTRLHTFEILLISRALNVPIDALFEEVDGPPRTEAAAEVKLGIMRAFSNISDEFAQRALLAVSRALAGASLVAQQARELGLTMQDVGELMGSAGQQPKPEIRRPQRDAPV